MSVQLGASFDFAAGRVKRAPRWMQQVGLETPFRILQEPRRLLPRYTCNALFLMRRIAHDLFAALSHHTARLLEIAAILASRARS